MIGLVYHDDYNKYDLGVNHPLIGDKPRKTMDFFKKMGFREVAKTELPHKIWSDCLKCPKFPECDETALIIDLGENIP